MQHQKLITLRIGNTEHSKKISLIKHEYNGQVTFTYSRKYDLITAPVCWNMQIVWSVPAANHASHESSNDTYFANENFRRYKQIRET
jgi:hypothetical protein